MQLRDGALSPSLQLKGLTQVCRSGDPFPTPPQLLDPICGCCTSPNFCNFLDQKEAIVLSLPGECKYFGIRTHLKTLRVKSKQMRCALGRGSSRGCFLSPANLSCLPEDCLLGFFGPLFTHSPGVVQDREKGSQEL